ncbi:SufB/SufD family protein [Methanomassiliicoccus luminyensis]|uniref:SufB/SufD family protein n=1 Tax=Methanomassiliicoccus luminyensis TaxID=1080712 RepID=UPI0003653B99|nr:SufD family Fe-S cluster assembly protein [Methanomassiliicoccus luminyensis]
MPTGEDGLKERARKALNKQAKYGEDIDLDKFKDGARDIPVSRLSELPDDMKETLLGAGVIPTGEGREGSLVVLDSSMVARDIEGDGFELLDTREALKKHSWLRDYSWKAVQVDADKYTAATYLGDSPGYFIHALPGKKVKLPVQTCLMVGHNQTAQTVHNIIVVEEGASLEVVSGCTTRKGVEAAIHLGISEFYVKKGGSLTFTMIHNWADQVGVRPRTGVIVEEGGSYVNNYVVLKPVKSIQMYPTANLVGKGSVARFNTIAVAHPGSVLDLGSKAVLAGQGSRAEIIARSITTGGTVYNRGTLVGEAPDIKAHLECRGLILGKNGVNVAIPELDARVPDVEMTHEASLGKIARDQVDYIMSRGLTEDEAVGMIVRGFLEVGIRGIPEELKAEIDKTIAQSDLASG